MRLLKVAIVVCLALASSPVPAQLPAGTKPPVAKPVPNKPAVQAARNSSHKVARKSVRSLAAAKPETKKPPAAIAKTYEAMPPAERLAIQADLAWTNYYDGPPGGDFDDARTIDAIKSFQKGGNGKETGVLGEEERARLAEAAKRHEEEVGWRVIDDAQTGARFGVPEKLVSPLGASRTGSRWTSRLGQIQIEDFRLSEANLPALFEEEKKTPRGRQVEWSALKPDSFVISGTQGLKNFVVRAESGGSEVRGITILYDQATAGIMDAAALAVANSFQGFPDPNAAPPPGQQRAVEYGTALVVDRSGDLITSRQVTAGCDTITVPGFGHADRFAEDKANDLALIRLYGARDLVPAPLAAESQGDDLTLVGIASPAEQQGGAAVSSAPAHASGQGVEPAPRLGFSGAAAVDAQGRFAGMVELKWPVAAAGDPVTPRATLVPAAAIRAFLSAHGIVPLAGQGAMAHSVVRVICVRR